MQIIPTINCPNFKCVKNKLKKAAEFSNLPAEASAKEGWVQLDIADGKFTKHKTWNKPSDFKKIQTIVRVGQRPVRVSPRFVEIHLMVEKPLKVIGDWITAGVKRVIIHIEALENSKFRARTSDVRKLNVDNIWDIGRPNIEFGLAINPSTPVEELILYLDKIKFVLLLAVHPGLSGQKFQPMIFDKIKFLKKHYPKIKIEVDGGINLKTAKLCKKAGADILAVGSYIWDSKNPKKAFEKLAEV